MMCLDSPEGGKGGNWAQSGPNGDAAAEQGKDDDDDDDDDDGDDDDDETGTVMMHSDSQMAFMHRQHHVHRDIKSDNILVDLDGPGRRPVVSRPTLLESARGDFSRPPLGARRGRTTRSTLSRPPILLRIECEDTLKTRVEDSSSTSHGSSMHSQAA